MNRRKFLESFALGTSFVPVRAVFAAGQSPSRTNAGVKRVLVMFKCHFDLGFIDTQAGVIRKYFDIYYPQAIQIAHTMHQQGGDGYIWTTGSWLLYEYLEQAKPDARAQMEAAVNRGDIAWHALPFSWQTELLDRSMIEGLIGLSKTLDRRFGRKTTGAKMTDVPGHSRGLVGPLAESGVEFLDIGVNSASTPPDVPDLFNWQDPEGRSVVVMYHRKEYGGIVEVPGSDLAVSIEVRNDNSGPHTPDEIRKIYADLRARYPNAQVKPANLSDIAEAVTPFRSHFPVFTEEIGDTWIYGVPSDPVKVARYRELLRLRREWIARRALTVGSRDDLNFLRRFGLGAEHTWGTDTKTWLDFDHYRPKDLATMLDTPHYQVVQKSWAEKRDDLTQGVAALPPALRHEAETRLAGLAPHEPEIGSLQEHHAAQPLDTEHFVVELDPNSGAIRRFQAKSNGRNWASENHPLALFTYQTLSKQDYDRFLASYITVQTDWAPKDFGKPNIEKFGARSRRWTPKLVRCWSGRDETGHRLVGELAIDDADAKDSGVVGWPAKMFIELKLPVKEAGVEISFTCFGKPANRLPEALWLTFQPDAPQNRSWKMQKVDRWLLPYEVVSGGNRHMHALTGGLRYQDDRGSLTIETLDAPVVALGEQSPIYFSNQQPDLQKGVHFSLFNNGWGTNYIQWFGEDIRARFILRA